ACPGLHHQRLEITPKAGYMPADEFIDLLQEGLNGELEQQVVDEDEDSNVAHITTKLVDMLAKPQRGGRDKMLPSIASIGPQAWPELLKSMSSERLAVRAAAGAALAKATGAMLPFD